MIAKIIPMHADRREICANCAHSGEVYGGARTVLLCQQDWQNPHIVQKTHNCNYFQRDKNVMWKPGRNEDGD